MTLLVHNLRRLNVAASFELHSGECVALQGPSGSGKTLLLRALADLDPNTGEVTLDGTSRESMPAPLWRKRVTYVAAEPGWWGETVREHFESWVQASRLLERVGLPHSCGDWPITRLSTGERQRLGLVRALMLPSCILLLDEPTSALDPETTSAVEALIGEKQAAGTGVLWASHDVAQVQRVASRLLVICEGRLEERSL